MPSILLLKQTANRTLEILVFLLDGVGLSPRHAHTLRLGYSGRVAINIIDNVIVVHHQTTKTSMLFDIALIGEPHPLDKTIMIHNSLAPGKSIKPCSMKLPSISLKESSVSCDLYSANWVLFQPNVVIDAKLGYLWHLELVMETISTFISDRVVLVEFLLMRTDAKQPLLDVLKEMLSDEYNEHLPVLEVIFNKLNKLYK